jgi:hypothetical protein
MVVDAFRTQALGGSAFLVEAVNLFSWLQPDSPLQAMWGPGVQITSWSDRDSSQTREIAQGKKIYTPSRAAVSCRRVMIISDLRGSCPSHSLSTFFARPHFILLSIALAAAWPSPTGVGRGPLEAKRNPRHCRLALAPLACVNLTLMPRPRGWAMRPVPRVSHDGASPQAARGGGIGRDGGTVRTHQWASTQAAGSRCPWRTTWPARSMACAAHRTERRGESELEAAPSGWPHSDQTRGDTIGWQEAGSQARCCCPGRVGPSRGACQSVWKKLKTGCHRQTATADINARAAGAESGPGLAGCMGICGGPEWRP